MKDHTLSSCLRPITTSNQLEFAYFPRLTIVTGKGGVGKTTFAMSLTKFYQSRGLDVFYHSFEQPLNVSLCEQLNLPVLHLDYYKSAEEYVALKLGSDTIAKWVLKTPFFKSLLDILPGLNHLIFLGHLIYKLEQNPELYIVIDSPSTGHALSVLKSTHNFKDIFGNGLLVKDIERIHKSLYAQHFCSIFILSLASLMSITEAKELKQDLEKLKYLSSFVLNDLLSLRKDVENNIDQVPHFLKSKIDLEKEIINSNDHHFSHLIAHESLSDKKDLVMRFTKGFK